MPRAVTSGGENVEGLPWSPLCTRGLPQEAQPKVAGGQGSCVTFSQRHPPWLASSAGGADCALGSASPAWGPCSASPHLGTQEGWEGELLELELISGVPHGPRAGA